VKGSTTHGWIRCSSHFPSLGAALWGSTRAEAFLVGRLESLTETRGRFALNTSLPIAFNGSGALEVDLLCADARVAVELDGAQHLSDPVAIAATGGRINCCRRAATSSCGSSPKTSARS
jgi:hypothetical protein